MSAKIITVSIDSIFDYFERNNFRENPICEYVLG